jgi:hypothetical protein
VVWIKATSLDAAKQLLVDMIGLSPLIVDVNEHVTRPRI